MLRSIRPRFARIYLDYAAATPVGKAARRAMRRAEVLFANPSSIHRDGVETKAVLESARTEVARTFGARAEEVFFTSGGTEGLMTAINGVACAAADRMFPEVHVIALATDHAAVTQALAALEKRGVGRVPVVVEYVPVDERGFADPAAIARAVRETTALIVLSRVNGEYGVIHPTRDVARAVARRKEEMRRSERDFPYVVVDACQAPVVDTIDRQRLGADVAIVDGVKCYGPRGVGAVMCRHYVPMNPLLFGGGQENGMRSGTQNVPAIAGLAAALSERVARVSSEAQRLAALRDALIDGMLSIAQNQGREAKVNGFWKRGDTERRAAHVASVCISGVAAEMLVLRLDARGFSCSHASACASSGDDGASTVIAALDPSCAASTLRVSVGESTRPRHVRAFLRAFAKALPKC